jgi:WD40 repeat protein
MVKHTGNCTQEIKGYSDWVNSVTFSQALTLVASADGTDLACSVVEDGIHQELKGHSDGVNSAAFSYDSVLVPSSSDDWAVRIFSYFDTPIRAIACMSSGAMATGLAGSLLARHDVRGVGLD